MSGQTTQVGSSTIFSKISYPALNILDALASLARERGWDLSQSTGEILGTLSGASTPSKPFIVGLIPPDVSVNFVPVQKNQSTLTTLSTTASLAGPSTAVPVPKGFTTAMQHSSQFYQKLSQVASSIGANPADMLAVMLNESGTNPAAINHPIRPDGTRDTSVIQAVGLIQFTQTAISNRSFGGVTLDQISRMSDTDQLDLVQKYYKNCNYGGNYPSTGALYLANFAPAFLKQANSPNTVIFTQGSNNYFQNQGLDHGRKGFITVGDMTTQMDAIKGTPAYQQLLSALNSSTNNKYQYPDPTIPSPDATPPATTSIMTNANVTAQDASADPLASQLGRNIQIANGQRQQAVQKQTNYLSQQISLIQSMPSLMMLVNPSEFSRSYEHTTDPVKTRSGYVVNMWLERPMVISSKGVTAAQYAFRSDGSGGLSHFNRIQSASYQNLMSLVSIFKNNGNIFTDTSFGDGNQGIPLISISLYIYYDNHIYIGSFDEFDIVDDGNKPFNLSYNWKFTVRYDIDTTQVSDTFISNFGLPSSGPIPPVAIPPGISSPSSGNG